MANLKELIKETKNNPKLSNIKVKIKSPLIIKKSLKELNSDHYWDKVEIIDPWYPNLIEAFNSRGFFYYLDAGNGGDVIRIGNSGEEKFKHWFETYTDKNPYEIYGDCDISKKFWGFSRLPRDKAKLELANLFKNASKVFGRDGNDKSFLNQDAFEFLKIATGHEPLSISYQVGEEFFLKDFENDVDKIGDDIVVEQRVVEGNNNPSKVNLNDFSSSRMHGSTGGNPFNDLDVIRNTIGSNVNIEVKWEDIHEKFTREYWGSIHQRQWKALGFNYYEARAWIRAGLDPDHCEFASILKGEGYNPSRISLVEIENAREKYYNAQTWLDKNYPMDDVCRNKNDRKNYGQRRNEIIELDLSGATGGNLTGFLKLEGFDNLEKFWCYNNDLTGLDVSQCSKLKLLDCNNNKKHFTSLNLNLHSNITELICRSNNLTNLNFLNNLSSKKLEKLYLNNNNFPRQDLSVFSKFNNLKELVLGNYSYDEKWISQNRHNRFFGSLKHLKNLNKLEKLGISNTDISHGLEYLSDSVRNIDCSFEVISESRVNDIWEELHLFGGNLKKWRETKWDKKLPLLISPLLPPQLISGIKEEENFPEKSSSDFSCREVNYEEMYLNQWKIAEPLSPKESPLRLYSIRTKQAELTENNSDKEPYAILSYVWGDRDSKAMEKSERGITNSANKALNKALEALKIINEKKNQELRKQNLNITDEELEKSDIKYLWDDQLCMNQADQHEKSLEVPKMGKYYDNATLTLIAMDSEVGGTDNVINVLKKIVSSEWFQRSWTFQEGWLSKHTVFMFDDKLVDGRAIAGVWALNQLSYIDVGKYGSRAEFNKGTKKIATPVGWTYYRDGYNENDKVELKLHQALKEIKMRKRTEPIDGIYSILGLLPYGKEVEVSYSKSPEQALFDVMKVAVEHGQAEPFSWHGLSSKIPGLCWIPQINKHGSTCVEGGIDVDIVTDKPNYRGIRFDENGISLEGASIYIIEEGAKNASIYKLEEGFETDSGLYKKDVKVKPENSWEWEEGNHIEIALFGTIETLNSAKEGNFLAVFDRERFPSKKPFALLVGRTDKKVRIGGNWWGNETHVYHRLGLVELGNEKLKVTNRDEVIRDGTRWKVIGSDSNNQLQEKAEANEVNEWQNQIEFNPSQK